ncbi:MAG: tetratricopeptide repeat protein [Treponema sp.]|nr:tetratricopeptide repeat protein [Treponema sp.]
MKKIIAITVLFCSFAFLGFSSESATRAFVEGCKSYSQGDWASAKFMLKKAVSYPENITPDTYYMLISAEINDGDNKGALDDCNYYLEHFPESLYSSRVSYFKGKVLYNLGEYEKAIVNLSDFCHENESDDLYSYALFYIGEALFAGYKYDQARAIYETIVNDYSESAKAPAAQYRIDTIDQRSREEKLIYLLKQTGEEYLSAKEDYEKQLRMYNSESINNTRQKLEAAQTKNEELERQVSDLEAQLAALRAEISATTARAEEVDVPNAEPYDETQETLRKLKAKALEAQRILEEKNQ